jgi:hypothetical protein
MIQEVDLCFSFRKISRVLYCSQCLWCSGQSRATTGPQAKASNSVLLNDDDDDDVTTTGQQIMITIFSASVSVYPA